MGKLRSWCRPNLAALACGLSLGLASCAQDGPAKVAATSATSPLQNSLASFLSPRNQRGVVADTMVEPRLDESRAVSRGEPTGFINARGVNRGPGDRVMPVRLDYETTVSRAERRSAPIGINAVEGEEPGFNPQARVSLNFENEPLSNVVRQILGGILRVNFVADPDLAGRVTLRTERPIPSSQVLEVLQDILGRNGYAIRLINGVYQVGTLEQLEVLAQTAAAGSLEGGATRVIRVPRGDVAALADIVNQILPEGTQVVPYEDTGSLVLKGNPTDFQSVESLVVALVDTGVADQRVAIFQLRESPPDAVAVRVMELFEQLGAAPITVLPLAERQAIMVASPSAAAINDVRRIVREIDIDLRDRASLRVLQLTHLTAVDVAEQLNGVFGNVELAVAETEVTTGTRGSNIVQSAVDQARAGVDARTGDRPGSVLEEPEADPDVERQAPRVEAEEAQVRIPNEAVSIVADPRNNALLVRSTFEVFEKVREVVRALDVPIGQVVIEANILEVELNDDLAYGVQWFLETSGLFLRSSSAPGASRPEGAGLVGLINSGIGNLSLDVVVTALQSVTDVKVLSSPYVTVVDGATARLSVGDQIPFVTASQSSSSGGTVTVTQEIETRDTGVILEVTPAIRPDNSVLLQIEQEVSTPREVAVGGEEVTNPIIAQRNITSAVTIQSGRTALLGGLIVDRENATETGVPVLRRIPVLGAAFRQRENVMGRSELLVLITPRVVRRSHQLELITRQLRSFTHAREMGIIKH